MAFKKNRFGSYILQDENGQEFTVTKKEYKDLQTYTKRANQRRVDVAHRYYDKLEDSDFMTGKSYDSYMKLLEDKGFITEKYSTSLKQFKSKDDVKDLIKELKTVTTPKYGSTRLMKIRYKMLEQINKNYGSAGKDLYDRINTMNDSDLLSMYLTSDKDIIHEIFYLDDEVKDMIEKTNTEIDVLLNTKKGHADNVKKYINEGINGSLADNETIKTNKKGWDKFKRESKKKTPKSKGQKAKRQRKIARNR